MGSSSPESAIAALQQAVDDHDGKVGLNAEGRETVSRFRDAARVALLEMFQEADCSEQEAMEQFLELDEFNGVDIGLLFTRATAMASPAKNSVSGQARRISPTRRRTAKYLSGGSVDRMNR